MHPRWTFILTRPNIPRPFFLPPSLLGARITANGALRRGTPLRGLPLSACIRRTASVRLPSVLRPAFPGSSAAQFHSHGRRTHPRAPFPLHKKTTFPNSFLFQRLLTVDPKKDRIECITGARSSPHTPTVVGMILLGARRPPRGTPSSPSPLGR